MIEDRLKVDKASKKSEVFFILNYPETTLVYERANSGDIDHLIPI